MGKHSKFKKKVKMAEQKIMTKEESAEMQEMQDAEMQTEPLDSPDDMSSAEHEDVSDDADVNPPSTVDDGGAVAQPVPAVPPQVGTGQEPPSDELLKRLSDALSKLESIIPGGKTYIFDLNDPNIRQILVQTITPIARTEMQTLLRDRQEDQEKILREKRQEVEMQGKQFVTESDTFASMVNFYNNVCEYHDRLARENDAWMQYVKSFTEDNVEIREHRRTEYEKAVNCLKTLETNIKSYLDTAIENKKANLKSAPIKPDNNDFWAMLRYCLISVPSYKAYCFLTDRYTLGFFHTTILTVLIVLLGLIGFMARDMAKYEREAEKYDIVRLWSYTDDTTPVKERHRILDALFEDKKHNMEEINKLIRELNAAYTKKRDAEAKIQVSKK